MVNLIVAWCIKHKMVLSSIKSVMMLLQGTLDLGRPPAVYLGDKRTKMVPDFKYLGVTFESGIMGIKIGAHIENISTKSRNLLNALRRMVKREWWLGYRALKIVYKDLFVAIATYGVAGGGHFLNTKNWRTLTSAQRHALIGVTRSYRTVYTEAVQVSAGVLPIKLEAERRALEYKILLNGDGDGRMFMGERWIQAKT